MENSELPITTPESKRDKPFDVSISTRANERHPNRNEDTGFCKEKNNGTVTFGVFDGMGGESNGRESSNLCSAAIESQLDSIYPEMAIDDIKRKLETISEDVNDEFLDKKSELHLGGSTGVFGMILPDKSGGHIAVIANIGDSRAYVLRNGELIKITTDDSKLKIDYPEEYPKMQEHIDEAMSRAELTSIESAAFDTRNAIGGYFGNQRVKPEIVTFPLEKGDILLVTTDGVHDNLTTSEIRNILNSQHSKKAVDISRSITDASAHRSHEEENFRHKSDDMTVFLLKVGKSLTSEPNEEIITTSPSLTEEVITTSPSLPEEFIPTVDQSVNVQRNSGFIETGWVISEITKDGIIVVSNKEKNGQKRLTFNELDRFNRQAKPIDIITAKDFNQLFFTLTELGGVQGTERYYSKDYLINAIVRYLDGSASLDNIPRSNELRDVVQKLSRSKNNNQ